MVFVESEGAVLPHSEPESREEHRQRTVVSLGLSEARGHTRLDPITRLACKILDVPMAAIEVLDVERVLFPSRHHLPVTELPRSQALSQASQTGNQAETTTIVRDTSADPRLADLVPVVEHGLRFYAGHPLRDGTGTVIGTFCLYDVRPRDLDEEQLTTFRDLAAWAEHEMIAGQDMAQAGRVQASLLPARPVHLPSWEVDGLCLPALSVGGDFYDFVQTEAVIHVVLGDVMGKGAGAALLGAGVRSAIRNTNAAIAAGVDLGVTCTQVARRLLPDLERTGSFVTLFDAAIELDTGDVRYVDAGSGLALIARTTGEVEHLRGDDPPYGMFADDHWTERRARLEPGDRLLVFSDGLLDLLEDPHDWLEPIGELVHNAPDVSGFLRAVSEWTRRRTPLDDVTVVVVARQDS